MRNEPLSPPKGEGGGHVTRRSHAPSWAEVAAQGGGGEGALPAPRSPPGPGAAPAPSAMSGAGGERPPLPSAPPAKLRRLDSPAGPGLEASPPAGNPESSSTPDGSPERGKLGREAGGRCRGGLETATGRCWEQSTNRKRRLRPKGGLETTNGSSSEQSTSGKRRSQAKGGLETTTRSENGGLETTPEPEGSLETATTPKGSLETATTPKGSLETATTPKGSLETTTNPKGGLETATNPKGSLETATTPKGCLETTTNPKGSLETATTPKGSLETATTPKGSLETATNNPKGGLETATTPKGGLETATNPKGGLETATNPKGGLETATTPKGSLETATTPKGSLETATTGCPEQNGEAKGQKKRPNPEDCAVISLGEEEEEEEEEGDEGPGRYLAALEAVQLELEAVEEEAARAFRRLRAKFGLRRRPHLQRRNHLIQHIPGFWVTAFLNHPQLSAMISDRDEDALSYMTGLQVEEFGPTRPGCRIRFFFSGNPYFQNRVVAKEFVRGPSGHLVSHSTPIRWWQGQDPRCRPHKGRPAPRSFFAWFGDHSFPAGDRVAEIIKEELWPNPLPFYLLGEGAEGPPESESGEDSVVIVEDDEDVQEILDDGDGSGVEEVMAEPPQDRRTDPKGDRG